MKRWGTPTNPSDSRPAYTHTESCISTPPVPMDVDSDSESLQSMDVDSDSESLQPMDVDVVMNATPAATGTTFGPGPMSPQAATDLFNIMAAQSDIAFKFPADGCYARAHLMVQRMQQLGADPGKVWTSAGGSSDPLWVTTPNHPADRVEWSYHVAPTIPVQQADGTVQDMVVDPSMFDRPVTIDEWRNAQHDHPTVVQTRPGQSPLSSGEGSGYWPSSDPPEGPDEHARGKMEEYKRYESTRGP